MNDFSKFRESNYEVRMQNKIFKEKVISTEIMAFTAMNDEKSARLKKNAFSNKSDFPTPEQISRLSTPQGRFVLSK